MVFFFQYKWQITTSQLHGAAAPQIRVGQTEARHREREDPQVRHPGSVQNAQLEEEDHHHHIYMVHEYQRVCGPVLLRSCVGRGRVSELLPSWSGGTPDLFVPLAVYGAPREAVDVVHEHGGRRDRLFDHFFGATW